MAYSLGSGTALAKDPHHFTRDNILGTGLEVQIIARNEQNAQQAFEQALEEINRLNKVFSGYETSSECSQLSQAAKKTPIKVSKELFLALRASRAAKELSRGRFTIFSSELSQAWKLAAQQQRLPGKDDLLTICQTISAAEKEIVLNRANRTVTLGDKALKLNLDAIAKGIIIDASLQKIIGSDGVSSAMVNIGGDIACGGQAHPWPVEVRHPESSKKSITVPLCDSAIATSGHYHRFITIEKKQFSHIIDAQSGAPVQDVISATIIAPSAAEADMLATVTCLLDVPSALKIINQRKNCHALIIDSEMKSHSSKEWPTSTSHQLAESSSSQAPVSISFELAFSGKGKKSDRHYTVVWVENQDGEKVKDILLWHKMKKRKYLKTLKAWYSKGGKEASKDLEFLKTISEATKKAGSYSLEWDHSDNQGQTLPPGIYTINIEVNREDGPGKESPTHTKVKIDTRNKVIEEEAEPQPELRAVQIKRTA